ncbi:hypothetical protein ADL26_03420 [Thermoactinomyces vulgaris]|nr:hypothetical protein ADL26_03420 [Thermoactinomyces vulgaris]
MVPHGDELHFSNVPSLWPPVPHLLQDHDAWAVEKTALHQPAEATLSVPIAILHRTQRVRDNDAPAQTNRMEPIKFGKVTNC